VTLGELIKQLEKQDQGRYVKRGFGQPHSYRGYYNEVAFEHASDISVASMLEHARSAIGPMFEGYKGGEYHYTPETQCWLAEYGCTDDSEGGLAHLLDEMFDNRDAKILALQSRATLLEEVLTEVLHIAEAHPDLSPKMVAVVVDAREVLVAKLKEPS
jgi:hypothetical protein